MDIDFDEDDYELEEDLAEARDMVETPEERLLHAAGPRRAARLKKHQDAVSRFLGKGKKVNATVIKPDYYGELLSWALDRYVEAGGWKVVRTLPYGEPAPRYIDVNTGCGKTENHLRDGTLLLAKGEDRLAATIELSFHTAHSVVVTGAEAREAMVKEFAAGLEKVCTEQNFYRGKKLEFQGRIRFLDICPRSWDSIALDEAIKKEIKVNTVGFLANGESLAKFGVPARRGIILVGEPGTGKTLICKALMADSEGITCLMSSSNLLEHGSYLGDLYRLAQDLAPCIVFIEDIDLIGQKRLDSARGSALLTLLSIMDGVEEQKQIVTIATTNYLDILDKALAQRPSRFDLVIELSRPGLGDRRKLVAALCRKAPLDPGVQEYLVARTEGHTPAQVQEVVYSLVIKHVQNNGHGDPALLSFTSEEVDAAVRKVGRDNGHHMGFRTG